MTGKDTLTKQKLRNALFQLLAKKEIQDITVAQLCRTAGVYRSVFYANYSDITVLKQELECKLIADAEACFSGGDGDIRSEIVRFLQLIRENTRIFKSLFSSSKQNPLFDAYIKNSLAQNQKKLKQLHKNISDSFLNMYTRFYTYGTQSVLQYWIDIDFTISVDEMATFLLHLFSEHD